MRDSLKALFFYLCAFWFITQGTLYAQNQTSAFNKIRVAVLDFEGKGISQMDASVLTDRLRSNLVETGAFDVIERGKMEEIFEEMELQLSGCISSECAVQVGQLLGVSRMITGTIGKFGKTYTIDVRVIDIESSRIIEAIPLDYTGELEGLLGEIRNVAFRLSGKEVEPTRTPTPPKVEEAVASLSLVTVPTGVTVYVDGMQLGLSPINLGEIRAGKHSLRFTKKGYADDERDIIVEPGKPNVVTVNLVRLNEIKIVTKPREATVYIDEELKGQTPLKVTIRSGNYTFRLEREGFDKWEKKVKIDRDSKFNVTLLKMIPVQFLSEPIDAEVYMNNKFIGRTPTLTTIVEGKYSIIFRKENYTEVLQEKEIHSQVTLNVKLKITDEYKKQLAAQSGKKSLPWFKIMGGTVLAGGAAAAALILGRAADEPPSNGADEIGRPPDPPN